MKQQHFNWYHEGIAEKGSNEICTSLMRYINDYVLSTIGELYIYSDNCTGQNKSNAMIRLIMAVTDSDRFKKMVYRDFQSRSTLIYPVVEILAW